MALGTLASVGGLTLSALAPASTTVTPGPAIVLLSLAGFVATWPLGVWVRHRARLRAPFAEVEAPEHVETDPHPHDHGPACGHVAVSHGDHVDYVHGGHRHAAHDEHYDEH